MKGEQQMVLITPEVAEAVTKYEMAVRRVRTLHARWVESGYSRTDGERWTLAREEAWEARLRALRLARLAVEEAQEEFGYGTDPDAEGRLRAVTRQYEDVKNM